MTKQLYEPFERLESAFARRDIDALMGCWSDDIAYCSPNGAIAGVAARVAAEHVWLNAFPDVVIERVREFVCDDTVILEGVMRGTHLGPLATPDGTAPPTGRTIVGRYVSIMSFVDGKVVDQKVYFDRLDLMEQLGLLPDAEAAA